LEGFVGQGVVCSIMDKASNTLTWQCPHDYCRRLVKDLTSNGVYQVSTEDATTVIARHAAFLTDQGMAIDPSSQAIPYYVGCPKMHKDPVDMRFISSSASSSMKCISVWINRALNGMQREVDMLFADSMHSIDVTAPWAARSWILKNAGDMLSLIHAWNSQYADASPAHPDIQSWDFQRLYTNIQLAEMKDKIMQLVSLIFHSDRHQHHVALKVRAKKHAFWLKAQDMPPEGSTRYGSDTQGEFFIFDMETFETWLTFLLGNMYVGFGGDLFIQAIGTPMGTNCASNLCQFLFGDV